MSTIRVVRPRPLGVTDRIPVFWAGQEPSQELKQIDGGALYRHLIASTTPATNRKRKKPERYHAPKEGEPHEHFSPHRKGLEQQAEGPIAIPQVRGVEDYVLNQQAAAHHGPMVRGEIHAAPYLRHKELLPGMYEEHQVAEYDADDRDIAWLSNLNTKNGGQGLFAAAVGLYHQVAQRISRHNSAMDAAATPSVEVRLSVDDFEKAIDLLEMMHYDAVKAWWDEQQTGPTTSAPQVPEIPPMKRLLPRATALEHLSRLIPDSKLASQLLEYWVRKRQQEGGPLLPRIWFEQPWKLVAFAEFVVSDDEDFDEHLPFMAVEPRSACKNRRTGNQRRRPISDEDAMDALYGLRNELEVLRTLADQVRKREKLKRQLLVVSQQETQMRVQLGLPAAAPIPRAVRQQQRLAPQSRGAGASAAAAGTLAATATVASAAGRKTSAAVGRKGLYSAKQAPSPAAAADGSKRLSQATAVAAAAAAAATSPSEGSHGRQTRTAAAAAAVAFDIKLAAKKETLSAGIAHVQAAAAPSRLHNASAAAQLPVETRAPADEVGANSRRHKHCNAADESARGDASGTGRARAAKKRQQRNHAAVTAESGEADDEGSEQPAGSPAGSMQGGPEPEAADQQPPKRRRRLLRSQQQQAEAAPWQHQQLKQGSVRPGCATDAGQQQEANQGAKQLQGRRTRSAAAAAVVMQLPEADQQEQQQRQQQRNNSKLTQAAAAAGSKLQQQHQEQQDAQEQQQQQRRPSPTRARQKAAAAAASRRMHTHAHLADDSDDVDYTASEEEELTDEWQLQHLRRGVQLQAGGQRLRRSAHAAADASDNSGSSSEEGKEDVGDGWERDEEFRSRSPRTVRRVQQLQLQQQQQQRKSRPSRQPTAAMAAAPAPAAEGLFLVRRGSPGRHKVQVKPVHLQSTRRHGFVNRRQTATVHAVDVTGHNSGSDDDGPAAAVAVVGARSHRSKQQQVEQLANSHAAHRAGAIASSPAELTVLKPHNQQQRAGSQMGMQHKASSRPGSAHAATGAAAPSEAVAARSAGAPLRPASGNGRSAAAGASVRRLQAVSKRTSVPRRAGASERELRKLGFDAPGPAWQLPAATVTPTKRHR